MRKKDAISIVSAINFSRKESSEFTIAKFRIESAETLFGEILRSKIKSEKNRKLKRKRTPGHFPSSRSG